MDGMDNEVWRWIWLGMAGFLAVAEIFTAGFFLLPFAVGAVVAFVLAFVDVPLSVQWVAFIVVSLISLWALQRFVKHEDEDHPAVGANRFVGKQAMVLESVDGKHGTGRVRMETEQWRATTEMDGVIEAGTEVTVTGVVGSRLIVEPKDQ